MCDKLDERVYLVRHGRTAFNADGRLRGHLDPPLDEVGRAEAADLGIVLGSLRLSRIVASPLLRAMQTAEIVAAEAAVPVVVDKRLIDRDYGPWAGERQASVIAEWGSLDAAPGVEPAGSVAQRVCDVLDAQVADLAAGPVVLVAHDAINRALLCQLDPPLGPPERIAQRTACWNVLSRIDGVWAVERVDQKVE